MRTRFLKLATVAAIVLGATVVACEEHGGTVAADTGPVQFPAVLDQSVLSFNLFHYAGSGGQLYPVVEALGFNAPGPYVYRWSWRSCPANVDDYDCNPNFTTSSDSSSMPFHLPKQILFANGTKVVIVGHIRQAVFGGKTGADTDIYVITPTPHGRLLNFTCADSRLQQLGFPFPFDTARPPYDTVNHRYLPDTVRNHYYYRNPCTGSRIYNH